MAASTAGRDWDVPEPPEPGGDVPAWDDAQEWDQEHGFGEEEWEPEGGRVAPTKREFEWGLADFLLSRFARGVMTATDVCIIAYWAAGAGATGEVVDLARPPNLGSSKYSTHLRKVLRLDDKAKEQMVLTIPGQNKSECSIVDVEVPCVPPDEAIHKVSEDPGQLEKLAGQVARKELPPMYFEHPVVRTTQTPALPVVLYVDGVPVTRNESVLGFWANSVVSGKRHLVAMVRKSRICRCGCRGWCTLWPIFSWLRWSFTALATGVFPSGRPDRPEWDPSTDGERSAQAGMPLSCVGAIVAIKGDWAEFAHTFALPA